MKYYWKILLVIIFTAILFSGASAFAQETETKTYTLLQPLPGMNQTMPVKAILPVYLSTLFKFMLTLAGVLAVLMIVFAGIMYITSGGNASQVEKAKSRIWSAVGGLVLAVSAYLILYTINPNLVNLDLGVQPIKIQRSFTSQTKGDINIPPVTTETPLHPGDVMYECKFVQEETENVYREIVRDCSRCPKNLDVLGGYAPFFSGSNNVPLKSCGPVPSTPNP